MEIITSITGYPKQNFILRLENNEAVSISLYYYATQQSWYYDFEYNGYINKGNKVVLSLNALRHLRNRIPFGIAFLSGNNAEPFGLNDFLEQKVLMILLNKEDVQAVEDSIYNV